MIKWFLLFLPITVALLSACSSTDDPGSDKENNVAANHQEENSDSIEVDKGLLNVEVTLPANMFKDQDIDSVIAEANQDGVEVNKNEDGSLTYKMSKSKHKELMSEIETGLLESIEQIKSSGDYASIQDITYNKSFSEFTMIVDKDAYENSMDGFAALGLAISGMYYQLYDGVNPDNYEVKILVEDAGTGVIFNETVYPDALEE